MDNYIKQFEKETGAKVVYLSKTGSRLYGTDTLESDTDYKGVFVPSKESVLMKTDLSSYSNNSNNTKIKNTSKDVDFVLHNIYDFFNHLSKSETGSVDLLFSMFRKDTIYLEDKVFTEFMRKNYTLFLNKNMKSFIGYSLGQVKKFGIKGQRYDNLVDFIKEVEHLSTNYKLTTQIGELFGVLENLSNKFKYIKMVMADGPKTSKVKKQIPYISVLGKLFHGSITLEYFIERIKEQQAQFGNRTKAVAETVSKTDFKALSHSLRIALETKELLETNFIKFPLKDAEELKQIKKGSISSVEEVIFKIESTLEDVDILLEKSHLPKETDQLTLRKKVLFFLNHYERDNK